MLLAFFGMFLILALLAFITEGIMSCTFNISNPIKWFKGDLTRSEFKVLLDLIFNDPNADYDGFRMRGGGYQCWVANGYFSLSVNGVRPFTPIQIVIFYREFKRWKKKTEMLKPKTDPLHRVMLAEKSFQNQVDSILDRE